MKRTGSILLFLLVWICVCLMGSPFLKYIILEREGSKYKFGGYSAEEIDGNIEQAEEVLMEKDIAIPSLSGILKHIGSIRREDVIGEIAIEEIDLYLPVFNGTTKANLMAGAGTMQPGQKMGEGNYSLAGHHMRDQSMLFGPLLRVSEGQRVYLTDKTVLYTYVITEIKVIHQSEIEVMEETEVPSITLITCDKTGVNTDYRFMVRGELLNVAQIEEGNEKTEAYLRIEKNTSGERRNLMIYWLSGTFLFAGILFLILKKFIWGREEA